MTVGGSSMQRISVFDMFKIGVGPSSSHTMGPWRATQRFLADLDAEGVLSRLAEIKVDLFGSLAKTGKGHGTDVAVQLGLSGEDPETVDVAQIPGIVASIAATTIAMIAWPISRAISAREDIRFLRDRQLPFHPNALRFEAKLDDGSVREAVYYSVGGGFIVRDGETTVDDRTEFAYPAESAADLLAHCQQQKCRISEIVLRNELAWRPQAEVHEGLAHIWDVMLDSIYQGCHAQGELPGGLHVHRRAAAICQRLLGEADGMELKLWLNAIREQPKTFRDVLDWVCCFALAVNEQNAAFGRIVTAPTNGAAGVIPAVLLYYLSFCDGRQEDVVPFLLTAGEIGSLFKARATISAALGGCQAEIGVSSAMAAAALTECLGGSPAQSAAAAEIAMEHHLGLTCDPIAGLVQIPCIERNCMGAVKAITAATLALERDPAEAKVSLDGVIKTMWETAKDMSSKYKETAEGGLAVNIPVNLSEC